MRYKKIPLKKGDLLIFGMILLLIAATCIFLFSQKAEGQKYCIISQEHDIIKEVPLFKGKKQTITVSGQYQNIIEIDGERVRVLESSCPNQFCVHTGWITEGYQTIACLPNSLLIRIVSGEDTKVDIIS